MKQIEAYSFNTTSEAVRVGNKLLVIGCEIINIETELRVGTHYSGLGLAPRSESRTVWWVWVYLPEGKSREEVAALLQE